MEDNYNADAEHTTGPSGCLPDCAGCIAASDELEELTERVTALMQLDYPAAIDYNVIEDGTDKEYAEILDKDDKRIAVVSETTLTRYFNRAESEG